MAKSILLDEIHISLLAPGGLNATEYGAIRRTLIGQRFLRRLSGTVREVLRRYPSLRQLRLRIER